MAAELLGAIAGMATVPWLLLHPLLLRSLEPIGIPASPAIGEAMARAGVGLAGALLVGASAIAAGTLVLRLLRWQTTYRIEHLVFAWTIGVGVISYGSLLLAVMGLYRPLVLALFIGALLLIGAVWPPTLRADRFKATDMGAPDRWTIAWLSLTAVFLVYTVHSRTRAGKGVRRALVSPVSAPLVARGRASGGRGPGVPLALSAHMGTGFRGRHDARRRRRRETAAFRVSALLAALVWRAARWAGNIPRPRPQRSW